MARKGEWMLTTEQIENWAVVTASHCRNVASKLLPFLKDRSVFWDVGGNIGQVSRFIMDERPGVRVFLFEPVLEIALAAAERVGCERATVLPVGASDQVSVRDIQLGAESLGWNTVEKGQEGKVRGFTPGLFLPLDDLVLAFLPPNVLKIDVEGHEEAVLKGAHHLILRHRPVMLIETTPTEIGALAQIRRLIDQGFYEETNLDIQGREDILLIPRC